MTGLEESGDVVVDIVLSVASSSMTELAKGQ